MAGASPTEAVFAFLLRPLATDGVIDLDAPLAAQLARRRLPIPEFAGLSGDPRWRALTPRTLLSQTSGVPNWR